MNRRMAVFVGVAAGFFLSVLGDHNVATAQGPQQTPERAEAPVYREGDWWEFKIRNWNFKTSSSTRYDGVYKLSFSNGDFKAFYPDGSEINVGLDSLYRVIGGRGEVLSQKRYLNFPLFVGKKWTFQYRLTPTGARYSGTMNVEVEVVGIEKVTVAGGTFSAFKIEREDLRGYDWHYKYIYYYSPETKSMVKFFVDTGVDTGAWGKTEVELVKFGSAAPGAPKGD